MPVPSPDMSLPGPEEKRGYVQDLFDRIAPRYDFLNRVMTAGRDGAWRRKAVAILGLQPGNRVLDLGSGTGDFLPLLAERGALPVGADFSRRMLLTGLQHGAARRGPYPLVAADALRLPFADASFDGVINGFLLRNVADVDQALGEMLRVLRSGRVAVCLEISWPTTPLFRQAFGLYFGRLVPLMGQVISGDRSAYAYLPRSAAAFMGKDELADRMRAAGFSRVRYETVALGTVAIYRGER